MLWRRKERYQYRTLLKRDDAPKSGELTGSPARPDTPRLPFRRVRTAAKARAVGGGQRPGRCGRCERSDGPAQTRCAIEVYTRQARDVEAETKACEIRLRAERRCGQMLRKMEKAKGARGN